MDHDMAIFALRISTFLSRHCPCLKTVRAVATTHTGAMRGLPDANGHPRDAVSDLAHDESSSNLRDKERRIDARIKKMKISDDELARRRQEVKHLKEQISAARPHAAELRQVISPLSQGSALKSPRSTPQTVSARPPASKDWLSQPSEGNSDVSLALGGNTYARRGHFDKTVLPRSSDTYEVENLRAKLGEMEAKLLSTQSQLIRERESSRIAKARLSMELQTKLSSEEHDDLVHVKASLEHQLQKLKDNLFETRANLEYERKERQLREVEIDRLQRSIAGMHLQDGSVQPSASRNRDADGDKIQELCQVNLTLLGQKRSAIKHVVAMNREITDIAETLKVTVAQLRLEMGLESTDENATLIYTASFAEKEEEVSSLRKALEIEQKRSQAVIADMQEELRSVHQSWMSECSKPANDSLNDSLHQFRNSEGVCLKLDMRMSDVENSVEFVQTVKMDACTALGVSASRIHMHGLRAGSVIVDMVIQEKLNPCDRTPGELLSELLRQIKDPSSELMKGKLTQKAVSIEVFGSDEVYKQMVQARSSSGANDSTRSTSNWIELVEQQTAQLKRQTADILELEHLNSKLTGTLDQKESSLAITQKELQSQEMEMKRLKEMNGSLEEQVQKKEVDASKWKRAFSNLEAQLNEHNALIKKHMDSMQRDQNAETSQVVAELTDLRQKYTRVSQDLRATFESFQSVVSATSPIVFVDDQTQDSNAEWGENFRSDGLSEQEKTLVSALSPTATRIRPIDGITSPKTPAGNWLPMTPVNMEQQHRATSNIKDPRRNNVEEPVDMTMNLELSFDSTGVSGSLDREEFELQLQKDLSDASGLPVSSFEIKSLSRGGVIVKFAIYADSSGCGPEPLAVAVDLEKQASDPNSSLRAGILTRHVQEIPVRAEEHKEYKQIRGENQRLREQAQHLRAKILKAEGEIENRQQKIQNLDSKLTEQLEITKTLQAQLDDARNQLDEAKHSNKELADRLRDADEAIKTAHNRTEGQHGMEAESQEIMMLRQAKEESASALRILHREKDELEAKLRDAEGQIMQAGGEHKDPLRSPKDLNRREDDLPSKLSEANKHIHDLQVQGVQLAQAKIFLEEKVARLAEMQDQQKNHFEQELNEWKAKSVVVNDIVDAVDPAHGSTNVTQKALESQVNQMGMELTIRDKQIKELKEALFSTRRAFRNRLGIEGPDESDILPALSTDDHRAVPGPDGGSSSNAVQRSAPAMPRSQASHFGLMVDPSAPQAPPVSPAVSSSSAPLFASGSLLPVSPPSSPTRVAPSATESSMPAQLDSTSPASTASNDTSMVASYIPDMDRNASNLRAHATTDLVPDTPPTFPASTQISLHQTKPTYQGELKDGWPHGRGITVWPDGRVYDGHWRKGIFQGTGTCVWSNGDTYEGEWEEGFAHGLGKYTYYASGHIFEGTFSQDKFHGHGVFASGKGGLKFRGCWNHGKMAGWSLIIGKNGQKIKQFYDNGVPTLNQMTIPDDLYGRTLIAVSEVVKMVREQTDHIRQMRAVAGGQDTFRREAQQGALPGEAHDFLHLKQIPIEFDPNNLKSVPSSPNQVHRSPPDNRRTPTSPPMGVSPNLTSLPADLVSAGDHHLATAAAASAAHGLHSRVDGSGSRSVL